MTEWRNSQAQTVTKLTELVGVSAVVKFAIGEKWGVIEEIVEPVIADDFQHSIDLSKFKICLESENLSVIVHGSALSAIEAELAGSSLSP